MDEDNGKQDVEEREIMFSSSMLIGLLVAHLILSMNTTIER